MEQAAIVVRVEDGTAWVEVSEAAAGCGRCHETGGCQSGMLTRLFRPGALRDFPVANAIGAVPGERVVVAIPDGAILAATAVAYLLPILGLLVGAFAGAILAGDPASKDGAAAVGAALGVALVVAAGWWMRGRGPAASMRPVLLRKGTVSIGFKESCK